MTELPFHTTTQFAGLALALIAGWLFGLATRSGGRKWRERYQDEIVARDRLRKETEAELIARDRRIAELEAQLARPGTPAVVPAAVDVRPDTSRGGWFGWGRDNLSRIRGIDGPLERQLNDAGLKTYRGIETLGADEEIALEQRLGLPRGTIASQGWREQAALLRAGNEDEHGQRFGG